MVRPAPVADFETGAYERVPGRRLALTAVGLLAAAGGVGTFVFAVNVAGAASGADTPVAAQREAPPSAMADGGAGSAAAAGLATSMSTPRPGPVETGGRSPGQVGGTPSVAVRSPAASAAAASTMGVETVDDDDCRWCDDPHDGPDQDGDSGWWSHPTPTPTPTGTATPQPSPSDDLSMPTADD